MSPVPVKDLKARAARRPRPKTHGDRILDFLQKKPDLGWRAVEIARKLELDPYTVGSVLRRLRTHGYVDQIDEHWFALDDHEVAQIQGMRMTMRLADEKLGPEDPADWPLLPPRKD